MKVVVTGVSGFIGKKVVKELLKNIPVDTFFNMTDLINKCLLNKNKVAVFPVHEYWTDIGTPEDLDKARKEFQNT